MKLELIFGILFRLWTDGRRTDGRRTDGRVEVIIMLSQLLVVAVVEVGAELGKKIENKIIKSNGTLNTRQTISIQYFTTELPVLG